MQAPHDLERDVEPHQVEERERSHWMVASQRHHGVDVVGRRIAFLQHPRRVVQIREQQPVHDEPGPIPARDRDLP